MQDKHIIRLNTHIESEVLLLLSTSLDQSRLKSWKPIDLVR